LWKPGDDLSAKMLERVGPEGVTGIVSIHPSADKYLFVGEFGESWQFAPTRPPMPKTDLWLVNKDGTDLRRVTDNQQSHDPVWSPSGEEAAFISNRRVRVLYIRYSRSIPVLFDSRTSADDDADVEYSRLTFSPNGKALAALAKDGTSTRVVAGAISSSEGGEAPLVDGFDRYEWNGESELVLDYGRLVFDWEHLGSDTETSVDAPALKIDEAGNGRSRLPRELLKRLLRKLRSYGVMKIGSYAISPSGNRVALEGVFDESPKYAAGPPSKDLWLVNMDGSGLRRMTFDQVSYEPGWSPSGKEVSFTAFGFFSSVGIIDVKTGNVRWYASLQALDPGAQGTHAKRNWGYSGAQWSPNGKVIAAVGQDGEGDAWITVVDARSGNKLFQTSGGGYSVSWSPEGELVIGNNGKFVFDWSSGIFNRR
jgi:Tol biopolymer transport system component